MILLCGEMMSHCAHTFRKRTKGCLTASDRPAGCTGRGWGPGCERSGVGGHLEVACLGPPSVRGLPLLVAVAWHMATATRASLSSPSELRCSWTCLIPLASWLMAHNLVHGLILLYLLNKANTLQRTEMFSLPGLFLSFFFLLFSFPETDEAHSNKTGGRWWRPRW